MPKMKMPSDMVYKFVSVYLNTNKGVLDLLLIPKKLKK